MYHDMLPDTGVFVVHGRTVASNIKWGPSGEAVLALTGEKLREVLRRVDSVSFFRDGKPVEEEVVTCVI